MKDAYYYLYETTNLTNKRKYIGQHCTYDMNDGYYGTSKELKEDIKSGHNYKVNIIKHFDNIFDLGFAEFMEIKKRNAVKDPTYYNKDGRLYFNYCFERNKKILQKVSEGVKRTWKNYSEEKKKEWNKNKSNSAKNKPPMKEEVKKQISKTLTGRKAKPETLQKRKATLDKKNAEKRKKNKEEREYRKLHPRHDHKGEKNPMYGKGYKITDSKNGRYNKPTSEITRKKISNALRNKPLIPTSENTCIYCGAVQRKCIIVRFHNEKCRHRKKA